MKVKLYARLVLEGAMTLEEVPEKYRLAVELEIEKLQSNI